MSVKHTLKPIYDKNSKVLVDYYKAKGVLYPICPEDPTAGNASVRVVEKIIEKCHQMN